MVHSIIRVGLMLGVISLVAVGCSKPASQEQTATDKSAPAKKATATVERNSAPRTTIRSQTPGRTATATPQRATDLEKNYRAATESDQKSQIVYQMGEMGTREA